MADEQARPGAGRVAAGDPDGRDDRFRRAMTDAAIGMAISDRDGRYIEVNPAMCAFYGRDRADMLSRTWQELTYPDDLAADLEQSQRMMAGELDDYRIHKRYVRADGAVIYGEVVISAIHDETGRVAYSVCQIVDQTESVHAREALAAREADYRLLAENASDVVVRGTVDGQLLWLSPSVVDLLGWSPDELVGRRIFDLVHPDDLPGVLDANASLERGEPARWEARIPRKDGGWRWVGATVRPVIEADGSLSGRVGSLRGIDAEVAAREALRAAVADLEEAQRVSRTGSYVFDVATDTSTWSDELNRIYGRPPGSPGPTTDELDELVPKGGPWTFGEAIASAVEERSTGEGFEHPFRRPDGSIGWLLTRGQVELGPDGSVVRIRGTETDITELHEAREAARASNALASAVVHGTFDVVYVKDLAGKMLLINDVAARFTGRTRESMIGLDETSWFPPEQAAYIVATDAHVIETGEVTTIEHTVPDASGKPHVYLMTKSPLRADDGAVLGLLAVGRDITEWKRAEESLRQSEARLAEAQRLEGIGRLAGGVAHDFNNILTTINGTAELLAEAIPVDDPRRADVEAIRDAGARGAALTAQLLAFGRRLVLRPTVEDLGAVLMDIAPLLRRTIGEDVELRLDVGSGVTPVSVDRPQLEQVIVNLAFNARDAMPGGGTLILAIDTEEVDRPTAEAHARVDAGRFARLTVTDTGHGIDPSVLPHVFEPFFTTKETGRGTGLGLATVDGIVGQSGGWIDVTSRPGEGTTFTVHLPLADAEIGTAIAREASPAEAGSETILLVEDEAPVRSVGARMLRDLGYTVIDAATPEEALAYPDEVIATLDLLVTDVVMPGISGTRLAFLLRERRPDLPTVFISGFAPGLAGNTGPVDDGARFLPKPFTRADLAHTVRAALDEAAAARAAQPG